MVNLLGCICIRSAFEACTAMMIYYLPLYPIIKCIFLIFCMAPISQNGSLLIYRRMIRPLFLEHSATIDSVLNTTANIAGNVVENATQKAMERK
ncbi:unnamed protein product [Heterobilharzia americana]|nr:unnamed protein product [Heterobilharzia americana]